jgi:guanylate kinase
MASFSRPPEHEAFLADIGPYVLNYLPRLSVTNYMGRVMVNPVMGVVGVGKSTLMEQSGLHRVMAKTSRPARPGDTIYSRYYDFTKRADRHAVTRGIEDGTYVQMAIHPANGELYATTPKDFVRKGPNLLDVTTEEYARLMRDGWFGTIKPTYIVTSTFGQWQTQWFGRDGENPPNYTGRTMEAKNSLEFFLERPEMPAIINDDATESAQLLRQVALGETTLTPEYLEQGRAAAQLLLDGIAKQHPDLFR